MEDGVGVEVEVDEDKVMREEELKAGGEIFRSSAAAVVEVVAWVERSGEWDNGCSWWKWAGRVEDETPAAI